MRNTLLLQIASQHILQSDTLLLMPINCSSLISCISTATHTAAAAAYQLLKSDILHINSQPHCCCCCISTTQV